MRLWSFQAWLHMGSPQEACLLNKLVFLTLGTEPPGVDKNYSYIKMIPSQRTFERNTDLKKYN